MHQGKRNSVFVKVAIACGKDGLNERWAESQIAPTLNVFDKNGDARAVVLIIRKWRKS